MATPRTPVWLQARIGRTNFRSRQLLLFFVPFLVCFLILAGYGGQLLLRRENQRREHQLRAELLSDQVHSALSARLQVIETLARNEHVVDVITGAAERDNPRVHLALNTANEVARSELILVIDPAGTVVSSTDNRSDLLTGFNYAFRPYFRVSMRGHTHVFPAVGAVTGTRGLYLSAPIVPQGADGPAGVIALKIPIGEIESILEQGDDAVVLVSPDGVIFSSNRPDWIYRSVRPIGSEVRRRLEETRQFDGKEILPLEVDLLGDRALIDGSPYRLVHEALPIAGWQVVSAQPEDVLAPLPPLHQAVLGAALAITGGMGVLIFLLFANILHRRRVAAQLVKAEEKYHSIFENATMGIFQATLEGRYLEVSPSMSSILGYGSPAELRHAVTDISSQVYRRGEDRRSFVEALERETSVSGFETELVRRDGTPIWVSVSGRIVRDDPELGTYLEGFCLDITDKRDAEAALLREREQLVMADRMISLGILISGVAHEINNPNTFILSNAEMLAEAYQSTERILDRYYEENGEFYLGGLPYSTFREKVPQLCTHIMEGSRRIKRIVQELREYGAKGPDDLRQLVELNAVIRSAQVLLGNMIKKTTDRFTVEMADETPPVRGNYQRLEQVIINVIQNACQALESRDQAIAVRTFFDSDTGEVIFSCRDEGRGIPPEELRRVTDPFFTTKREIGGMGLGLSISSNIVREHGGRMELASRIGEGTEVTVTLPTAAAASPPERVESEHEPRSGI